MNILDSRFVYVPAGRQDQDGVLARWNKQRKRQQETDKQAAFEQTLDNVVFGDIAPSNQTHAG